MATDLERLVVQLSADVRGYENALKRAGVTTNRAAGQIENRFKRMNSNISASFSNAFRGLATAATVRQVIAYADAWAIAGNKIAAASQVAGRQARSLEEINKIASATRSELGATVDLYAKLLRATKDVAESEMQVARATEIINKAFKAGGSTASEMEAGVTQLSQALSSGALQGDELRSIRENAPLLAQAIAKEFQTTIGGLKELGAQGELTSDRVFKAILRGGAEIDAAFSSTKSTIGDAMTLVMNALIQTVGEIDNTTNASNQLVDAMEDLATAVRATGVAFHDMGESDIGFALARLKEYYDWLNSHGFIIGGGIIGPAAEKFRAHEALEASRPSPEVEKAILALRKTSDELDKAKAKLAELQALADKGIIAGPEMDETIMQVALLTTEVNRLKAELQELGKVGATAADSMADGFERARIAAHRAFGEFVKIPLAAGDMAKQVIRQFEGFRTSAYWDSNAYRIGYGSDTMGGTGRKVTQFSTTTKEEAERDLDVRIAAFQRVIVEQIGTAFGRFTEPVQAALTSVAYNYGRLPESVAVAARTGDTEAVARAVEALPANPQRRAEEAALIRTGQFGLTDIDAADVAAAEKAADLEKQAVEDREQAAKDYQQIVDDRLAALGLQQKEIELFGQGNQALDEATILHQEMLRLKELGLEKDAEAIAAAQQYAKDMAAGTAQLETMRETQDASIERLDEMRSLASDVFGGIVSDLRAGASAGEIFANVLDKIIAKLGDMAVNMLTTALFGQSGTAMPGLLGGLFGVPAIAGARASGGPVTAGSSYMVGEQGPEIFTPSVGGSILPNRGGAMGGELRGVIAVQPSPLFITSVQMATGRMISENNRRMPAYLADRQRRGI